MIKQIIPFFIALILLSGCNNELKEVIDKNGKSVTIENIVQKQKISKDSSITYAYYLPKNYDGKTKLPVLFLIDPHGVISQPLENYKHLADKYGYVFVGSEHLKNGLSATESQHLIKLLKAETIARFQVDEKRMFSGGFSGGAKLAISFAQTYNDIIGVIACGGSIPMMANQKPNYYYAGVVGNKDFNYLEVQQTFSVFDQQGYDFTSIIFNGEHSWPPAESFDLAMSGLELYSIKTDRKQKDKKWLDELYVRMVDSISVQENRQDFLLAHQTLQQATRWFYGLLPSKELNQKSVALRQNQALIAEMQKMQNLIKKEVKLRSAFIKAIQNQDLDWWKTEVDKINASVENGEKSLAQVSQRLLNYLSMACFMLAKTDLDDTNLDNAIKKIQIYEMVDSDNYDVYLMYARYFMLTDDTEKMNANYQKALDLGFNEKEVYQKDPSWELLMKQYSL